MNKKKYQKITMKVVNMACEHQLLAASVGGPTGPAILGGTNSSWSELQ
jgi:hypothetical protein